MMIVSAPPIEESKSRKRKRETEEGSLQWYWQDGSRQLIEATQPVGN